MTKRKHISGARLGEIEALCESWSEPCAGCTPKTQKLRRQLQQELSAMDSEQQQQLHQDIDCLIDANSRAYEVNRHSADDNRLALHLMPAAKQLRYYLKMELQQLNIA